MSDMSTKTSMSRSPRWFALQALKRVEKDHAYADIVLSNFMAQLSAASDRAFLTELTRGTIRMKAKLDWMLSFYFQNHREKMPDEIQWIVWLGLYQIHFMRIPPHAAVFETVELAKAGQYKKWSGVVNGILQSFLRDPGKVIYPDMTSNPVFSLAVQFSHPEWLVRRWIHQFGLEQATAMCEANNRTPTLSVRRNRCKCSIQAFEALLAENGIEFEKSPVQDFYRILHGSIAVQHPLLHNGTMTIQDPSAGLVGFLADPHAGQVVLDLCSAPGGKSTHLAELAENKATIVAGDIHFSRIRLLHRAVQKTDHHVYSLTADAKNFPARPADLVLLDAPCSGLGVLARKPDLRWNRHKADIVDLTNLQNILLDHAVMLVKTGGFLVYSTCTVEHDENDGMIRKFCQRHPEFDIVPPDRNLIQKEFITSEGTVRTWPHLHQMDGSYAVKLIKKGCS
jgi:16S rRNA (cytosine967-C5)-methyltransferase